MIDTWFISDTHFGHKNILEYEKEARPFETIEEMNENIIDRWNKVVKEKDIVFHLGDFAFGKHNIDIGKRLNGHKKLIMGNHDTYPTNLYLQYFEKLYGVLFYERCILSHNPVHPDGLGKRWILNIHGHLHSRQITHEFSKDNPIKIANPSYINVSCEQNNLTPIHKDIIMNKIRDLK